MLEVERTRVLAGHEVDMDEREVAKHCPMLSNRDIRNYSYPSVYYKQVRSAATHRYRLGEGATGNPMRRDADVSYVNRNVDGRPTRLIYFDLLWLWRVVRSIAVRVEGEVAWGKPREHPQTWWSAGG